MRDTGKMLRRRQSQDPSSPPLCDWNPGGLREEVNVEGGMETDF